jgi:ferrous iron transport protein B
MATAPETASHLTSPSTIPTIALVGNPNTGKTTLFNALSGLRQRVGNYPGVTVETKKGQMTWQGQVRYLIDLPGTYSLAPRSPDEMVAVDVLLGQQENESRPDVILAIVDASNLERNLYLTTQVLEMGVPVVVALNMVDVAASQGIRIDTELLEQRLGAPIVPIQANKARGLDKLREVLSRATENRTRINADNSADHHGSDKTENKTSLIRVDPCSSVSHSSLHPRRVVFPEAFEQEVAALQQAVGPDVSPFLVRRLLLDVGGYTEQRLIARHGEHIASLVEAARERLRAAGCGVPAVEAKSRYAWVREATAGCIHRPPERPVTWTDRLDRILTHRVWGTVLFLVIMAVVFQAIFTWARPLMDLLDKGKDLLSDAVRGVLPAGMFTSLLTGGIIAGVGSVLVFLPQILILFAFIAILEDCGYMARAAFLMDRIMARCGLSGKSFIPLLSSVACAVPGIMATRVIEDRRDRLATILVAPLMSCSARLPVYIILISAFLTTGYAWWMPGMVMFSMYALGLVIAPLVALVLKRTLLRGDTPVFVMEMPAYKWPSVRQVVRRTFDSGWAFVRRAGTLILATMVLVWALLYFPSGHPEGGTYPERIEAEKAKGETADEERVNEMLAQWKRQSFLGRAGQALVPVFAPLGWDWRISVAALASFPAREVVVGTLGVVFELGEVETKELTLENAGASELGKKLREAVREDGRPLFNVPVALSLMVFFALCCQCASTLAVIRRETRSWRWPAFTFAYMTILAYLGALVVYQVGRWWA